MKTLFSLHYKKKQTNPQKMQSISGVIGLIGIGGLTAYAMHHRQSENMRECILNMKALETLLKNVPQNEDGENKSQAIGRAVSSLEQWRSASWMHQAFNPPPWNPLLEEDSSSDSSSSEGEDESSSSDNENQENVQQKVEEHQEEEDDGIQEHQKQQEEEDESSSETF
jgi:Tfp pilus assembly protein PilX